MSQASECGPPRPLSPSASCTAPWCQNHELPLGVSCKSQVRKYSDTDTRSVMLLLCSTTEDLRGVKQDVTEVSTFSFNSG